MSELIKSFFMKKMVLLTLCLFQIAISFAQTVQTTNGGKGYSGTAGALERKPQYTPPANSNIPKQSGFVNTGERSYVSDCYKGLAFTVKNYGYSKSGNHYSWGIKVKNNYKKAVGLTYKLIVGDDNSSTWAKYGTTTFNNIKPGETYSNDYGTLKALIVNSSSDQFRIEVSQVCFEGQDCAKNGYADCNGNQISKSNGVKNNNTSPGNSTTAGNTPTTQQNDLTEYNRSKVDLERQMAEKNAEIQRQNQENANKASIWNNAIKAGVDAHNSGNYTEAKNQFSIAVNNSTNEQNRQNAQNYYNKSVDAEKSQVKIKAIGDLTNASINLISYFANRKNALRNSLSQEDGQALLDIVNSENPANYTQNIIQIFTDLGYTHRETENKNGTTTITLNNDVNNINDFLMIFIHPASYSEYSSYGNYNRISFSYHRKEKLLAQLGVLKNDLEGFRLPEIKGIPQSVKEKIRNKQLLEQQKEDQKEQIKKKISSLMPIKSNELLGNDISVQSIIDKCIIATGGEEKLKAVQNIVELHESENYNYKIIIANGKSASIGTMYGKPYKSVFDGLVGYSENGGNKRNYSENEILNARKSTPFGYILGLKEKPDLKLGAIESIGSTNYYTIIDVPRIINGTTYIDKFYFDVNTNLYFGQETTSTYKNSVSYYFYSDYKKIDGILFFTSSMYFNNNGWYSKESTTEIKINEQISDNDFK